MYYTKEKKIGSWRIIFIFSSPRTYTHKHKTFFSYVNISEKDCFQFFEDYSFPQEFRVLLFKYYRVNNKYLVKCTMFLGWSSFS